MTSTNNNVTQPGQLPILTKRMLTGAAIALILVIAFLVSAGKPNPAWPRFWMLRPLIVMPLAGACGGACYHFISTWLSGSSLKKVLAIILSLLVFIIGLWLGMVLGFAGTMWH